MTDPSPAAFLNRPDGGRLAYVRHEGRGPGVVWLGGFKSDMEGGKALALDAACRAEGRAFLRFDYFAHGRSDGAWDEATIGRWREDALAVIDELTDGPQVLVGSSMGGWMALLAALARPDRVQALVLIAPAPDFTEALFWQGVPLHVREAIEREGFWDAPSEYGEPVRYTRRLIEEARDWLILDAPIRIDAPVRILQGWRDPDVPWSHAVKLIDALTSEDVELLLIKDGDHRLSEPDDLERMIRTVVSACRWAP